jgi:flagellar biosynthesis/type III secretory pathway chaperone
VTDAERLLDGLRRQREKYREMSAVAADQQKALEASDMDRLLEVVERKRALLEEITAVETEIAPVRNRWEELKPSVDAALAKEIEDTVASTRDVLQALVKQEDEGRAALERQRQTAADELKDLMRKKQARNAYGGGTGKGPRFVDDSK